MLIAIVLGRLICDVLPAWRRRSSGKLRRWTAACVALFSLFHWPCSTTTLTVYKETRSLKWTAVAVLLPTLAGAVLCALTAGIGNMLGF